MTGVLEWVWDVAVSPVLDEFGYIDISKSSPWSHVWWITTDALSLTPLHAAGIRTEGSFDGCMERVISDNKIVVPRKTADRVAQEKKQTNR